jgi:hypothetical protein
MVIVTAVSLTPAGMTVCFKGSRNSDSFESRLQARLKCSTQMLSIAGTSVAATVEQQCVSANTGNS